MGKHQKENQHCKALWKINFEKSDLESKTTEEAAITIFSSIWEDMEGKNEIMTT